MHNVYVVFSKSLCFLISLGLEWPIVNEEREKIQPHANIITSISSL